MAAVKHAGATTDDEASADSDAAATERRTGGQRTSSEVHAVLKVGVGQDRPCVTVPLASYRRGSLALSAASAAVVAWWDAMWMVTQVDSTIHQLRNGQLANFVAHSGADARCTALREAHAALLRAMHEVRRHEAPDVPMSPQPRAPAATVPTAGATGRRDAASTGIDSGAHPPVSATPVGVESEPPADSPANADAVDASGSPHSDGEPQTSDQASDDAMDRAELTSTPSDVDDDDDDDDEAAYDALWEALDRAFMETLVRPQASTVTTAHIQSWSHSNRMPPTSIDPTCCGSPPLSCAMPRRVCTTRHRS